MLLVGVRRTALYMGKKKQTKQKKEMKNVFSEHTGSDLVCLLRGL